MKSPAGASDKKPPWRLRASSARAHFFPHDLHHFRHPRRFRNAWPHRAHSGGRQARALIKATGGVAAPRLALRGGAGAVGGAQGALGEPGAEVAYGWPMVLARRLKSCVGGKGSPFGLCPFCAVLPCAFCGTPPGVAGGMFCATGGGVFWTDAGLGYRGGQ